MTAGQGRPLRFIGMLLVGWIALRAVMLWPYAGAAADRMRGDLPLARAPIAAPAAVFAALPALPPRAAPAHTAAWLARPSLPPHPGTSAPSVPPRLPAARTVSMPVRAQVLPPPIAGLPQPVPVLTQAEPARRSRLSGSLWLVARDGGGITSAPLAGQLGGSQAGVRLAYLLDRTHRLAAVARITSPLGPGLREAAVGVEWQPTRLPVRIAAEQRLAIDGGAGGPAVELVGGFGPLPIGAGFQLDSYAQAGAIHRQRTEGFVDGAAHLVHPVATLGAIPVALGAGLWGGAQRDAERLDIGPSITAAVPIIGQRLRLSLDWRERVAGAARPGSGLALTIGADF